MKKLYSTLLVCLISIGFVSCEKSEIFSSSTEDNVNEFMWRGMNAFYFWQEKVVDLQDTRFGTRQELHNYYSNFTSHFDAFESMRYQPNVIDKFSWVVNDYVALENSFQAINLTNGMEFGLVRYQNNPTNLYGYVRYVIPNTDAASKGIVRGMIFNEVDGFQLTESNYRSLLFSNQSYRITLADFNSGNPVKNTTSFTLQKSQIQENPVAVTKVFNEGTNKIGYIMYNQFAANFDVQLNQAFANLKAQGVTDLIIDLRYNGGGSVRTASFLGAMITGQFNSQLFSKEIWNKKVQNVFSPDTFITNFTNQLATGEQINSLTLNRVYFITTNGSASASELIMNSLMPYITVRSVGTTTRGKVHGSITLYDSDNFLRTGANLNPNHRWAMQPLTFEIKNSSNNNFPNGIDPTVALPEDYGNLGVLGEKSDPLLNRTIQLIVTGNRTSSDPAKALYSFDEITGSHLGRPAADRMYKDL